CDLAIRTLEAILTGLGALPEPRLFLRNAFCERAMALGQLGRHAEAVRAWDRALALDAGTDRIALRGRKALSLVRAGDHAAAVVEAERLAKSQALFDASGVYAAASVAAAFPSAQPIAVAYAARAGTLLGQAIVQSS